MSSINTNLDKPLELIQKTYLSQTVLPQQNNSNEHSSQTRPSVAKVSTNQPSRKNSVHDINENLRDDLNKILIDIQENLSKLTCLLETIDSFENIKDDFLRIKNHLLAKILEFIHKLTNHLGKRGSMVSNRGSTNVLGRYPHQIVYCIEYLRTELTKSIYLFCSLTFSTTISISLLNSIILNTNSEDIHLNEQDKFYLPIIQSIHKDINDLEEHIYVLTQRYYSQIPDWHNLDESSNVNFNEMPNRKKKVISLNRKHSHRSSTGSHDDSSICNQIYEKCYMICCLCSHNDI